MPYLTPTHKSRPGDSDSRRLHLYICIAIVKVIVILHFIVFHDTCVSVCLSVCAVTVLCYLRLLCMQRHLSCSRHSFTATILHLEEVDSTCQWATLLFCLSLFTLSPLMSVSSGLSAPIHPSRFQSPFPWSLSPRQT